MTMSYDKSKGPVSFEEGCRFAEERAAKLVQELRVSHNRYLDEHPEFDQFMGYAEGESSRQPEDLPAANEPEVQGVAERYLEALVNKGLVVAAT